MSSIEARSFLENVAGYVEGGKPGPTASNERPVKLGTIDPYYTAGLARVLFDGETVMSLKGYSWDSAYDPTAGDRVYLVPVGQSFIIGGKVTSKVAFPKYLALPLWNNWVNYDTVNYSPATFTKTMGGVVKVNGMVKAGQSTIDGHVATLPVGFRPLIQQTFSTTANGAYSALVVHPNGEIRLAGAANNAWLSLDNIIFQSDKTLTWTWVNTANGFGMINSATIPASYAKDTFGRVWMRGAVRRYSGGLPGADTAYANLPAGFRTDKILHMPAWSGTGFGFTDHLVNGDVRWKTPSTSVDLYLDEHIHLAASVTGWTNVSLQSGWTYDGTYSPGSYYKDADGVVHLRGLMRSGTMGAIMFNLPEGMRPSRTLLKTGVSNSAASRFDIHSNGNVVAVSGSNGWFSLDGATFVPEQ